MSIPALLLGSSDRLTTAETISSIHPPVPPSPISPETRCVSLPSRAGSHASLFSKDDFTGNEVSVFTVTATASSFLAHCFYSIDSDSCLTASATKHLCHVMLRPRRVSTTSRFYHVVLLSRYSIRHRRFTAPYLAHQTSARFTGNTVCHRVWTPPRHSLSSTPKTPSLQSGPSSSIDRTLPRNGAENRQAGRTLPAVFTGNVVSVQPRAESERVTESEIVCQSGSGGGPTSLDRDAPLGSRSGEGEGRRP